MLGGFSTLKILQSPNFGIFRRQFKAKLCKGFAVPADTFDNVAGQFPIGFLIWCLDTKSKVRGIPLDLYESSGEFIGLKQVFTPDLQQAYINDWYRQFFDKKGKQIGVMNAFGNDFQQQNYIHISSTDKHNHTHSITEANCLQSCVYFAVRHCIDGTWLNDRDQFFSPQDSWKEDELFQWDCLVFTLFHVQNRIKSSDGPNHWVPFSEEEIGTKDEIKSHFMIDLLAGKTERRLVQGDLFAATKKSEKKPVLSSAARAVLKAGKALYRYYHAQPGANPDASFYDIRLHFQGTDEKGRMNAKSGDETYNARLESLRAAMKELAARIADGVYRHGFLK